jgi:hypothetical protein
VRQAFFTVGATLLQPVFTAGRTRSQVELAEARRDEGRLGEAPGLQITVEEGVRFWALDAPGT